MARNDEANDIMAQTSFLYGGNAHYIEDMYARFQDDPGSVPAEWHAFFADLKDDPEQIRKSAAGASWKQANWPVQANGELVSALDGNWGAVEKAVSDKLKGKAKQAGQSLDPAVAEQATRDSVRAIMMIRAFRMRGHLHANLDPLGLAQQPDDDYNELSPEAYGFTEADYDRPIFIDNVLGLERDHPRDARYPQARPIARPWGRVHAHFQPRREGLDPGAHRGSGQGHRVHRNGQEGDPQQADRGGRLRAFSDVKYTGTKRFGLDGGESLVPALEQIIKRGGNMGLKEIVLGMAHRGRLNVLANVMGKPHRRSSTSSRAARSSPTRSRAPAT
jgi:2-oxoglutarate dehydrogenase E1 component